MIQSDLSGLNVLVHGEDIGIIDFQECQWGHYLPNLVQGAIRALSLLNKENERAKFLEAYQRVRPLPEGFEAYYDLWRAAARLSWYWWE